MSNIFPMALVIEVVTQVLNLYWNLPTDEENRNDQNPGGYFTLMDLDTGQIIVTIRITNDGLSNDNAEAYCGFSQEKARRLFDHLKDGHRSSWQSRNIDTDCYGGAIVAGAYIISFSGLPEKFDEAVCVNVANGLMWIDSGDIAAVVKASNNPFIELLLKQSIRVG